jgi:tetratricopeptide (TPR) repeat protein
MKTKLSLALYSLVVIFSGCTSLRVGSEFGSGRQAYLAGNNDVALSYFQSAAQTDPDYSWLGFISRQGIWSYVGRTEYLTGKLPQARESLEKALSMRRDEELARLYLGLTLTRTGDRPQGLKAIGDAMKGIYDASEYVTQNFRWTWGRFWDPSREIRSACQDNLAMLSGKDVDLERLIANGEWLGKRVEQEIDWARRDQVEEELRDGAGRPDR